MSACWQGVLWKLLSCFCFASLNALARGFFLKGQGFSPMQVAFLQALFGLLWILPWVRKENLPQRQNLSSHAVRGFFSALGMVLWFASLSQLSLFETVALGFLGPLMTTVGAKFFLRETLGFERSLAIFLGTLGGVLIVNSLRLQGGDFSSSVQFLFLLPLGSACCFSASTLLTKRLAVTDRPLSLVFSLLLTITPLLGLAAGPLWVWPSGLQWGLFVALGGITVAAHFAMSLAFSKAEVTFLLPFGAARILLTALFGVLFFSETPNGFTLAGCVLIFLATWTVQRRQARVPSLGKA